MSLNISILCSLHYLLRVDEIENAHKLHWDVRISVLGFKSKIMALTDQLDELRKKEGGGGEGNGGGRNATAQEIAEVRVKECNIIMGGGVCTWEAAVVCLMTS